MQMAAGCREHYQGVTLEEWPGELSLLDHLSDLKGGKVHSDTLAADIYGILSVCQALYWALGTQ